MLLSISTSAMESRWQNDCVQAQEDPFVAVGLAYIAYALDKPAFFRAMWREEAIYSRDDDYVAAANELVARLHGGFAASLRDAYPEALSDEELLVWSLCTALPIC